MGFCMLVVCGLNKLMSIVGYNRKPFSEDKGSNVQSSYRNGRKRSFSSSPGVTSYMLRNVLLAGVFILIGLFCWKGVVRNRVWSSRETLFRYIQQLETTVFSQFNASSVYFKLCLVDPAFVSSRRLIGVRSLSTQLIPRTVSFCRGFLQL